MQLRSLTHLLEVVQAMARPEEMNILGSSSLLASDPTMGDPGQNKLLSQKRAEAVARYLNVTYDVDSDRIRAIGYGGAQPLPRKPDQSERAWEYGLSRVEIVLVREDL